MDARLTTPLFGQRLLFGSVSDNLGVPGARVVWPADIDKSILHHRVRALGNIAMPPLAKNVVDGAGTEVLGQWINSIDPNVKPTTLGNPADVLPEIRFESAAPAAVVD